MFYKHMLALSGFVQPRHLGIDEQSLNSFTQVYLSERIVADLSVEIGKLHHYRTPKDKLVVLINFVTVIARSSEEMKPGTEQKKGYADMDRLLTLVIYYLIKTQPLMLKSTARFIK